MRCCWPNDLGALWWILIISMASSNKSVIDRKFWEQYPIRIIYVQWNESGRRHCGRCCPWFVTPPSDGGFSATTEAIVRVWLPHPSAHYRSISISKKLCIYIDIHMFLYYQGTSLNGKHPEQIQTNLHVSHNLHGIFGYIRHILFSFNLDCPGAKGLTILSLLPGCAALIQLGFLKPTGLYKGWKDLKSVFLYCLLGITWGDAAWNLQKTPVQPIREHISSTPVSQK